MDKTILKKFAIESRQDLMQKIESKMKLFYVDETFSKQQNGDVYVLLNNKHTLNLSREEYDKRELLIKRINELGLEQVIEEAAYTWFNRIVAIRYMEINDYLPLTKDNQSLGIRVLSSKDNTPDPEIMKFTNLTNPELDIDFKKEKYIGLKDDNDKYKYVLLLVCKKMSKVIPQVFDGVTDYIDLLIPDNLLNDSGFIKKVINDIPENNYKKVEIIGWLYQYYNQLEKDRVVSAKKAYKKNEIPYATQLFTPDWIVKYMVQNSLGKFWIEHGGNRKIIKNWRYFVDDEKEIQYSGCIDPKQITCIDPCMGSGHILVYMFEVLYQIYESYGYSKNDIPESILVNNLNGLDIDDRAGQLAILAVILKAREYDKNIFNKNIFDKIAIMSIQENSKYELGGYLDFLSGNDKELMTYIFDKFKNGKDIGSLLYIDIYEYDKLIEKINNDNTIFGLEVKQKAIPLIRLAKILMKKYDVVVTNPPYMGNNGMNQTLKKYVFEQFPNNKMDLFAAFIERCLNLTKKNGYTSMVTMQSWMFLSTFYSIRDTIINMYNLKNILYMDNNVMGIAFGTVAFSIKNTSEESNIVVCNEVKNENIKNGEPISFPISNNRNNKIKTSLFKEIPGLQLAYWISKGMLNAFKKGKPFNEYADMFQGIITGDNNKFLRQWYEVDYNKIYIDGEKIEENFQNYYKWIPYNKGGCFRKWYGNQDYIIDWSNGPKDKTRGKEGFSDYYLREYVSWSYITSSTLASRFFPKGFLWDVAGSGFFDKYGHRKYLQALLGSKIGIEILKIINPTINYQVENVAVVPVLLPEKNIEDEINKIVDECVNISEADWNEYEISWKFKKNPLIKKNDKFIENILKNHQKKSNDNFIKCNENEKKVNEIINSIYELEQEISNDVIDTTIKKPSKIELIKSIISYAVGCMFGRYSLDEEGLIYAGGTFDESKYKTFKADADNIIPITDKVYFADDIVSRLKEFIEVVYGKDSLNVNLDFIAETLGKKGTETSEDTIRRYFLNDFYSDHIKMYQKKPIYWLFDSGKKNGFKALIYMHRYNENTVPKVRLDYLHRVQNTYDKLLTDVNYKLTTELSVSDKKIAQNRQADLNAKLQEIKEYDEKIAHIANQRISIDLDDGVTANYSKFADILGKIK